MASEKKGYSLYHAGVRAEINRNFEQTNGGGLAASASEPGLRNRRKKKARRGAKVPKITTRAGPLTADYLALRLDRMNKLVESTLTSAKIEKRNVLQSPVVRKLLPSIETVELQGAQKEGGEKRIIGDSIRETEGSTLTAKRRLHVR